MKSVLREVEREGGTPAYAQILGQRLTSADVWRMQVDGANDLARRQQEHMSRDVRGG